MGLEPSAKSKALAEALTSFMEEFIYPNESSLHAEVEANRQGGRPWTPLKLLEELKGHARDRQLWNLFLPESRFGAGLSNLE
jgi:acyl-CoA dehydrogenase